MLKEPPNHKYWDSEQIWMMIHFESYPRIFVTYIYFSFHFNISDVEFQ